MLRSTGRLIRLSPSPTRQGAASKLTPRCQSKASRFSTSSKQSDKLQSTSAPKQSPNSGDLGPNGNPSVGSFSLKDLGLSRNMKIFLIVVFSILGTMETMVYVRWFMRWYYGEQKEEGGEGKPNPE